MQGFSESTKKMANGEKLFFATAWRKKNFQGSANFDKKMQMAKNNFSPQRGEKKTCEHPQIYRGEKKHAGPLRFGCGEKKNIQAKPENGQMAKNNFSPQTRIPGVCVCVCARACARTCACVRVAGSTLRSTTFFFN